MSVRELLLHRHEHRGALRDRDLGVGEQPLPVLDLLGDRRRCPWRTLRRPRHRRGGRQEGPGHHTQGLPREGSEHRPGFGEHHARADRPQPPGQGPQREGLGVPPAEVRRGDDHQVRQVLFRSFFRWVATPSPSRLQKGSMGISSSPASSVPSTAANTPSRKGIQTRAAGVGPEGSIAAGQGATRPQMGYDSSRDSCGTRGFHRPRSIGVDAGPFSFWRPEDPNRSERLAMISRGSRRGRPGEPLREGPSRNALW